MKQVNYIKYGGSEQLQITEVSKPTISKKNSVLVKVNYSSLNAIDWKNRKGNFRLMSGWIKPRTKQGFDVMGTIVEKSIDITDYNIGDKVLGLLGNFSGGALSDYVEINPKQIIKLPTNIHDRQAAGLPMAGITAWQALIKDGKLKKNQKVLINGGSSGVGHLAIQIAKAYGAEVTTVSSTKSIDFCKKLGADYTIDYTMENFLNKDNKYDIIFDVVFNASLTKVRKILKPKGYYIGTTPTIALLKDVITQKQAKFVAVKPSKEALTDLISLMEQGKLEVKIDNLYPLRKIQEAHDYMEKSRTKGKLLIDLTTPIN